MIAKKNKVLLSVDPTYRLRSGDLCYTSSHPFSGQTSIREVNYFGPVTVYLLHVLGQDSLREYYQL